MGIKLIKKKTPATLSESALNAATFAEPSFEYRVKTLHDSVDALVKQGFDKGLLHDIILEMVDMGCDKDYITRHFDNLLDGDFLGFCVKKGLTPYQIALKLSNMGA